MTTETPPAAPPAAPAMPKTRTVTVEAPDERAARTAAAQALKVPEKELQLAVVKREKKGLFGLGGETLTIKATWHPPSTSSSAPGAATPPPADEPARIEFSCLKGKLSIAVHRPVGRGRAADVTTVEKLIEGWPLDARDESVIQQVLRAQDGKPRVFATLSPSVPPPEGAAAAVRVAKDDFTAWLIPWNPTPLDAAALFELVGNAGIVNGLDEELVEHLSGKVLDRPVVIARGQQPKNGEDARIEFVFEALQGEKEQEKAQQAEAAQAGPGRVDFREMGKGPASVEPETVLARKVALVPAEDGFTVKGKAIPAKKSKDLELRRLAGQNTRVSDDGNEIVATTGGMASRVGEKIAVLPVHTVDGDVDFKSGNVYFEGNLQIRGGIKPGFKVTATGSVNVGGTVEGATVEAGGDVTVTGGIVGQKEGVIRAGGAVTARFVQEAEIHAGGSVTVGSEIRESTVISERKVTVVGAGRVVGGRVRGRDGVELREAGSQAATPTSLQAGWGEELEAEIPEGEVRIPSVAVRNEVQPGVVITVAGATQRFTRNSVGGVWREKDGKLIYSAN
ncbi:MAG TPA: FapA family protein [Chloroflexota bacterium]|nr:FapA family protein [Chloroflexota bacterium]